MKSIASRFMKTAVHILTAWLFILVISGPAFAQSAEDVLKGAVKGGAKEMLGVSQPVEGRSEMMDGAKMMMQGRQLLREHLLKTGKLKEGEALEGGKMLSDGHKMIQDGDKLIQAGDTAQGKKKMLDGARMMTDAKKRMLDDLSKRRMIERVSATEGETMMDDGEKMMKRGETMMLR